MMTVMATACEALGLAVSEAKLVIMCLQTKHGGKVSGPPLPPPGDGYYPCLHGDAMLTPWVAMAASCSLHRDSVATLWCLRDCCQTTTTSKQMYAQ